MLAGQLYHLGEDYGTIKGIDPIVSREEWAMIKRAFPRLTLALARSYRDHAPDRFQWDRPTLRARRPRES